MLQAAIQQECKMVESHNDYFSSHQFFLTFALVVTALLDTLNRVKRFVEHRTQSSPADKALSFEE